MKSTVRILIVIFSVTTMFISVNINSLVAQETKNLSATMSLQERLGLLDKSEYWKKMVKIWKDFNHFENNEYKDNSYMRNRLIRYYYNEADKTIKELRDLNRLTLDEAHFLQALFYYRVKSVSTGTAGKGYYHNTPVFIKDKKDVVNIEEQFDIIEEHVREFKFHSEAYLKAKENLQLHLADALYRNKLPLDHEMETRIEGIKVKTEPYREINPEYIEFIIKLSK